MPRSAVGPGQTGEVSVTCAGEHGRAAAASGAPLEPIHDLLMSETQLRSSPSGTGRSLLGLEKDVCQRESALAPAQGGSQGDGIMTKKEEEAGFTEICLFLTRACARLLQHPMAHPVLQGSRGPHTLCEGQENPHGQGVLGAGAVQTQAGARALADTCQWVMETHECEEINLKQKHFPDTRRDRQTDRPTAAGVSRRTGERVGWRRQARSEAPWRAKRQEEAGPPAWCGSIGQRQRGTYGRDTSSAAWWWGRARRPRQGDGAARGLGCRAPFSLH